MTKTPAQRAARTVARRRAAKKAAVTKKRRTSAKKAAITRRRRAAGRKAAATRKHRAARLPQGRDVVLEVGAEGGSLTVFRVTDANGHSTFEAYRNEAALKDILGDEDSRGMVFTETTPPLATLADAIAKLDRYPWHALHPLRLHPDFATQVLADVKVRGGARAVERWVKTLKEE